MVDSYSAAAGQATPTTGSTHNSTDQYGQGLSDKFIKLKAEKKSAIEFQLRKHMDWNDNYELYRGKVRMNRLTQRQTVNIPLMKETIKTLMAKVDDAPAVEWKEKSGNQMKELIYQSMWDDMYKREDLELKDIIDKKNVFVYGLSTKKLNLKDDGVCIEIMDTFDILYDPQTKPLDVETARFVIHQNIFRSLRDVLADDRYEKEGKEALKIYTLTRAGIIQSGKNRLEWEKRQERLRAMGVQSDKFSVFAGGDVVVNLTEHFTDFWNEKQQKFVRHVVVYANDEVELCDDLLTDCIGVDLWPFDMWAEDPETNDVYPDGVADLVRTPNKILNIWFSQQVENRTLQNFQMHWFDATQQGYVPQTYEPGPGRMLPAPGDPNKTIMPVQINGLDETFKAMDYLVNMVERGTGATAIEKGEPEQGAQTLGEVQILVGRATERSKMMAKFYKASWYRTAKKWDAMMQANDFPKMKLYRTGPDGKVYDKTVYSADWKSEAGYEPTVASSSEQDADMVSSIQKFGFVMQQSPMNTALRKIAIGRELKLLDLSPAELAEVTRMEDAIASQPMMADPNAAPAGGGGGLPEAPAPSNQQPQPQAPQNQGIDPQQLQELASVMGGTA